MISLAFGDVSGFVLIPLLSSPLALVGFLDDRHDVALSVRYGAQLLTALAILFMSVNTHSFLRSASISNDLLFAIVTLLLLLSFTAIISFVNFMDGLDGLVAGCMAVSICSICFYLSAPWFLWVVVGAILGFLCWNWHPAKNLYGRCR
ncbi:hypothetical protein [Synechococcus sp. CBW1107]|uniref:hypothetical protein n=1 Tax=Synechococcus sp. CBW1107 TaxID=2789857 RepID=UPI002AD2DA09|nr:hypothetical protein [Synechococcus sp. CBW1107]